MENQHRKITGYRELSQEEIDLMNEIKALAEKTGHLVSKLQFDMDCGQLDHRWVEQGKIQLQLGFMALTRAVAQPSTF